MKIVTKNDVAIGSRPKWTNFAHFNDFTSFLTPMGCFCSKISHEIRDFERSAVQNSDPPSKATLELGGQSRCEALGAPGRAGSPSVAELAFQVKPAWYSQDVVGAACLGGCGTDTRRSESILSGESEFNAAERSKLTQCAGNLIQRTNAIIFRPYFWRARH